MSHEYFITNGIIQTTFVFTAHLYQGARSPLLAAIEGGHTETAQLLIDKGADVNKAGQVSALNVVALTFEK